MDNYAITIYWSAEDQAFIAEAPDFPGCAADGTTRQEAIVNLEIIKREWMTIACELKRAIPSRIVT